MKTYITIISIFISVNSFSQWKNEIIKNGFDDPFKVSTTSLNNKCYLKLEDIGYVDEEKGIKDSIYVNSDTIIKIFYSPEYPEGIPDTTIKKGYYDYKFEWKKIYAISLDLEGSYFCKSNPTIDVLLTVDGLDKKYVFLGTTHINRKGVEIKRNILENNEFVSDFENATFINIRVNDIECEIETFMFNMSGSKSAVKFLRRI